MAHYIQEPRLRDGGTHSLGDDQFARRELTMGMITSNTVSTKGLCKLFNCKEGEQVTVTSANKRQERIRVIKWAKGGLPTVTALPFSTDRAKYSTQLRVVEGKIAENSVDKKYWIQRREEIVVSQMRSKKYYLSRGKSGKKKARRQKK